MTKDYTFRHAVAAAVANGRSKQDAKLFVWSIGKTRGDELAKWFDENRHLLNVTPDTVEANVLWWEAEEAV